MPLKKEPKTLKWMTAKMPITTKKPIYVLNTFDGGEIVYNNFDDAVEAAESGEYIGETNDITGYYELVDEDGLITLELIPDGDPHDGRWTEEEGIITEPKEVFVESINDLKETISVESDLLLKLKPLSEVEIFEFMKNLRGGTYFNMGMYSSIIPARAYKKSLRIYKVIDLTAIVSGVSYENIGTTKDFRDRTGEAPGKSWYDHTPGFENKIAQSKRDPNSKYVLWDIKRGTGTTVRYFVVDIDTRVVTPVSKDALKKSSYLTETEKANLEGPKKVEGFDKDTGELIENKTNWRTVKFEHIFWLNQAGKATQEYGVRFEEDFNLDEAFGDDIFMDAHAHVRTDLDAILSGEVIESVEKPLNEDSIKYAADAHPVYVVVTSNREHVYTDFYDAVDEAEGPLYDEAIRIESRYELPDETHVTMSKTDPYYGRWTEEDGIIVTPQIIESIEKPLNEDADVFVDAHAGVKTKLDDVLSGKMEESVENTDSIKGVRTVTVHNDTNERVVLDFNNFEEAARHFDDLYVNAVDENYAEEVLYQILLAAQNEEYDYIDEDGYAVIEVDATGIFDGALDGIWDNENEEIDENCHSGDKANNLKESYDRRTISRGTTLVDNELFVDFD